MSFYFKMLSQGAHLQLCSMYKVKRAVLHHHGYNTGFISMRMENISEDEKGTIVFKAVSLIPVKFIANIMDSCLFWRSNVSQTTFFLEKISSKTKQEPRPFLPTTTQPTTQLSQRLHDYGRPLDQFVWCRLNPWQRRYFGIQSWLIYYIWSCLLPHWKEKSVSYNVKNKQLFKKNVFDQLVFISQADHTRVSFMWPHSGSVLKQA